MKTLNQLKIGQTARVTAIGGEGAVRRRILDMGILRGVTVKMVRRAPFGDPIEISLRGYRLTLGRNDAKLIEIAID